MTILQKEQCAALAYELFLPYGLKLFGWFEDGQKSGLLVGNAGSSLWASFSSSSEASDGMRDPMNRWTERLVNEIALELGADARFPFGETIWPFQAYAKAATGMKQSPIGLLIHPEFGLLDRFSSRFDV